MFTADIETENSAGEQDYGEQPLVAHSAVRRTRMRPRQRLRQRNNFNGKRKIAQCTMTTLVILLVLGIVIALVYAIRTSEFNDESNRSKHGRRQRKLTTVGLGKTKNILVATLDLSKWQPHGDRSPKSMLSLPCQQQDCGIDYGKAPSDVSYQAIVFDVNNIQEPIIPLLLDDESPVIYASQYPPATVAEWHSLKHQLDFGLTMSYRTDADIIWTPFEVLWPNGTHFAPAQSPRWDRYQEAVRGSTSQKEKKELLKLIEDRTQFAVMHLCNNATLGAQLLEELKIYLPTGFVIDVDTDCRSIDFQEDIRNVNYKFMLTFEDVLCTDTISPYFYQALSSRVVPVVFGGPTIYENFAPPQSYIRAEDFNSIRELAERLIYLDELPQEYLNYMLLLNDLKIVPAPTPICKLCRFLHEQNELKSKNFYKIAENWWTKTQCANKSSLLTN